MFNRYATVKTTSVPFMEVPSDTGAQINTLNKGKYVWVVRTVDVSGTRDEWAEVYFGGMHGYILRKHLTILSREASEQYDKNETKRTPVPQEMYGDQ